MVRVGGPERSMLDFFLLRLLGCCSRCRLLGRPDDDRRLRRDFLCARVLDRLSVARMEAVISGEGGSPNMKNFIKAAIRRTTEIWPRMKPCVKENLDIGSQLASGPGDWSRSGLREECRRVKMCDSDVSNLNSACLRLPRRR